MDGKKDSKSQRFWYALYTRPQFERKVQSELLDLSVETFLPLRKAVKIWSDRRKVVMEPLFPSYIFVYTNLKERLAALKPRGVVRIVGFSGAPTPIPAQQIDRVRRLIDCGYTPAPHPYVAKGDLVDIISGPLMGMRGYVVERRGMQHFVVSVDSICQSVSIVIDAVHLQRAVVMGRNRKHANRLSTVHS